MEAEIEAALPYLESRGITPETAEEYALSYSGELDAIVIPYFDALGRMRTFNRRNLRWTKGEQFPPKYQMESGSSPHLYNVVDADRPYVFITEGEFDCLILKQLGLYAVAVPGVKNFRTEWAWLFAERKVYVMFDADPPQVKEVNGEKRIIRPGQDAAVILRRSLMRVSDDVEVLQLPEGEDVTSLYLSDRLKEVLPL